MIKSIENIVVVGYEGLPSSYVEAPYVSTSRLVESYEVAQPPMWGSPGYYAQPKVRAYPLGSNEVHYGSPCYQPRWLLSFVLDHVCSSLQWQRKMALDGNSREIESCKNRSFIIHASIQESTYIYIGFHSVVTEYKGND